jgi:nicotinamide-nucleotide amidase
MEKDISQLALKLGQRLKNSAQLLATAESCTGGWIAQAMTEYPGSSDTFERGFVTYSDASKQEMIGVAKEIIDKYGAVSEQVARAMAEGTLRYSHAHISVSVTGIAGPTGDSFGNPVGLIWFGFSGKSFPTETVQKNFSGTRKQIRQQAVIFALEHLLTKLG